MAVHRERPTVFPGHIRGHHLARVPSASEPPARSCRRLLALPSGPRGDRSPRRTVGSGEGYVEQINRGHHEVDRARWYPDSPCRNRRNGPIENLGNRCSGGRGTFDCHGIAGWRAGGPVADLVLLRDAVLPALEAF